MAQNSNSKLVMSGEIDLAKTSNAFPYQMPFQDGRNHNVLVIDLDNNPNIRIGKKGEVFLKITVYEKDEVGKYGDTHYIRTSLNKSAIDALSEEQKKSVTPIAGNLSPAGNKNGGQQKAAPGGYYNQGGPAMGQNFGQQAPAQAPAGSPMTAPVNARPNANDDMPAGLGGGYAPGVPGGFAPGAPAPQNAFQNKGW